MTSVAGRGDVELGTTRVSFIPDGAAWINPFAFFPAGGEDGWRTHSAYLTRDGRIPVSIGSFLIRAGGEVILVDLGLGDVEFEIPDLARFRGGDLLDGLAADGITPDDVTTVVYTHLHHDHVGWTSDVAPAPNAVATPATGLTFAGARHLVAGAEWDRWKGTDLPAGPAPHAVQEPLAERVELVSDGDEVAPGVRVRSTPGHTPGHLAVEVTASDSRRSLLIIGDVMHSQVQVTEHAWACAFDDDPELAAETRAELLRSLDGTDTVVAAGHFAGSVFGRVSAPARRRTWSGEPFWSR